MKKWLSALLALLLLATLCGCQKSAPATQQNQGNADADPWGYNESRGYFIDDNAAPAMSKDGLKADLYEAYFTNNGHLFVQVKIGNGTDKEQRVDSIDVAIYDPETKDMIAGGIAEPEEKVTVKAGGVIDYTIYISPEHVQMAQSGVLPQTLSFEITIGGTAIEAE